MNALASYAALDAHSRGRRYPEPQPAYRSEYQRDRDRHRHSTPSGRLVYKTQVFVNHEGDLYRTRLTHSSRWRRSRAPSLAHSNSTKCCRRRSALRTTWGIHRSGMPGRMQLNELRWIRRPSSTIWQSLRVVDELEEHYAEFDGLNFELRMPGRILKHCSHNNAPSSAIGERFINRLQPGLEAQPANFADEIAYNNHGRETAFAPDSLAWSNCWRCRCSVNITREVLAKYPALAGRRLCLRDLPAHDQPPRQRLIDPRRPAREFRGCDR